MHSINLVKFLAICILGVAVTASPIKAAPGTINLFRRAPFRETFPFQKPKPSRAAANAQAHVLNPSADAQSNAAVIAHITGQLSSQWRTNLSQGLFRTPQDIGWMKEIQSYVERVQSEPFAIEAKHLCLAFLQNDIAQMESGTDPHVYNSLRITAILAALKMELAGTQEGLAFVRLDDKISEAYEEHQAKANNMVELVVNAIKQLTLPSREAQITAFHAFMEQKVFYQPMQLTASMGAEIEALFQLAPLPTPSDFANILSRYEMVFISTVWQVEV
ncbi:hypothetical protein H4R35_004209 [Dimargaris xerosporica]|nr:hypothetical protein H4R35_004209 [Dimargaris xerosporica]